VSKRLSLGVVAAVATFGFASLASAQNAEAPAAAAPAAVDPACTGNGDFTKSIKKQLIAAQEAQKASKFDDVLEKLAEAEADTKAPKTEFDLFWMHRFRGNAYLNVNKQYDKAAAEFEAVAVSPCLTEPEKFDQYKLLSRLYMQLDNFPKVIDYGNRALAFTPNDQIMLAYVAHAQYKQKDWKAARDAGSKLIEAVEKEGKNPEEQTLLIVQGACTQMKDDACATQQFEKLVKYYPSPQQWNNLMIMLSQDPKSTNKQQLNIMRLANQVDALKDATTFLDNAQIALDEGLPGEALQIIEKGNAASVFSSAHSAERSKRLMADAKAAAATDKATLAQQDAAARASKTGNSDAKLGIAYLSYGDTAKAIEALQRGIAKGGVKDPAEANLMLGVAFLRSDNKAEAAKAFQAVSGDAYLTRLAKLWLLNT
jgi:hypothetical protein